jgi:hypothetical protein
MVIAFAFPSICIKMEIMLEEEEEEVICFYLLQINLLYQR